MTTATVDRYISFCGIHCDAKADELMERLEKSLTSSEGTAGQWQEYFARKRAEQRKMQQDNLHFVGSQINTLAAYFEHIEDEQSLSLLWYLEEQCC